MSVEQMKAAILKVYPGKSWKRKVEKMKAGQILAIYTKFLSEGRFEKRRTT